MSHTPEPWHAHSDGQIHTDSIDQYGNQQHHTVAQVASHLEGYCHPAGIPFEFSTEANARRIVAAVNACAGIPTAALEADVVRRMREALIDASRRLDGAGMLGSAAIDPVSAILKELDQ